mmetsp:Transcript_35454/g.88124  ORF Transcript_35454/g.88124 Transcript_35454/m.88124 type:complete len:145 (+) Transcript_35454:550-984(+)
MIVLSSAGPYRSSVARTLMDTYGSSTGCTTTHNKTTTARQQDRKTARDPHPPPCTLHRCRHGTVVGVNQGTNDIHNKRPSLRMPHASHTRTHTNTLSLSLCQPAHMYPRNTDMHQSASQPADAPPIPFPPSPLAAFRMTFPSGT